MLASYPPMHFILCFFTTLCTKPIINLNVLLLVLVCLVMWGDNSSQPNTRLPSQVSPQETANGIIIDFDLLFINVYNKMYMGSV